MSSLTRMNQKNLILTVLVVLDQFAVSASFNITNSSVPIVLDSSASQFSGRACFTREVYSEHMQNYRDELVCLDATVVQLAAPAYSFANKEMPKDSDREEVYVPVIKCSEGTQQAFLHTIHMDGEFTLEMKEGTSGGQNNGNEYDMGGMGGYGSLSEKYKVPTVPDICYQNFRTKFKFKDNEKKLGEDLNFKPPSWMSSDSMSSLFNRQGGCVGYETPSFDFGQKVCCPNPNQGESQFDIHAVKYAFSHSETWEYLEQKDYRCVYGNPDNGNMRLSATLGVIPNTPSQIKLGQGWINYGAQMGDMLSMSGLVGYVKDCGCVLRVSDKNAGTSQEGSGKGSGDSGPKCDSYINHYDDYGMYRHQRLLDGENLHGKSGPNGSSNDLFTHDVKRGLSNNLGTPRLSSTKDNLVGTGLSKKKSKRSPRAAEQLQGVNVNKKLNFNAIPSSLSFTTHGRRNLFEHPAVTTTRNSNIVNDKTTTRVVRRLAGYPDQDVGYYSKKGFVETGFLDIIRASKREKMDAIKQEIDRVKKSQKMKEWKNLKKLLKRNKKSKTDTVTSIARSLRVSSRALTATRDNTSRALDTSVTSITSSAKSNRKLKIPLLKLLQGASEASSSSASDRITLYHHLHPSKLTPKQEKKMMSHIKSESMRRKDEGWKKAVFLRELLGNDFFDNGTLDPKKKYGKVDNHQKRWLERMEKREFVDKTEKKRFLEIEKKWNRVWKMAIAMAEQGHRMLMGEEDKKIPLSMNKRIMIELTKDTNSKSKLKSANNDLNKKDDDTLSHFANIAHLFGGRNGSKQLRSKKNGITPTNSLRGRNLLRRWAGLPPMKKKGKNVTNAAKYIDNSSLVAESDKKGKKLNPFRSLSGDSPGAMKTIRKSGLKVSVSNKACKSLKAHHSSKSMSNMFEPLRMLHRLVFELEEDSNQDHVMQIVRMLENGRLRRLSRDVKMRKRKLQKDRKMRLQKIKKMIAEKKNKFRKSSKSGLTDNPNFKDSKAIKQKHNKRSLGTSCSFSSTYGESSLIGMSENEYIDSCSFLNFENTFTSKNLMTSIEFDIQNVAIPDGYTDTSNWPYCLLQNPCIVVDDELTDNFDYGSESECSDLNNSLVNEFGGAGPYVMFAKYVAGDTDNTDYNAINFAEGYYENIPNLTGFCIVMPSTFQQFGYPQSMDDFDYSFDDSDGMSDDYEGSSDGVPDYDNPPQSFGDGPDYDNPPPSYGSSNGGPGGGPGGPGSNGPGGPDNNMSIDFGEDMLFGLQDELRSGVFDTVELKCYNVNDIPNDAASNTQFIDKLTKDMEYKVGNFDGLIDLMNSDGPPDPDNLPPGFEGPPPDESSGLSGMLAFAGAKSPSMPDPLPCGCDPIKTFSLDRGEGGKASQVKCIEKYKEMEKALSVACSGAGNEGVCSADYSVGSEGVLGDMVVGMMMDMMGAMMGGGPSFGFMDDNALRPTINTESNTIMNQLKFANPEQHVSQIVEPMESRFMYSPFLAAQSKPKPKEGSAHSTSTTDLECPFGDSFYVKLGSCASGTCPTDWVRLEAVDGYKWKDIVAFLKQVPEELFAQNVMAALDELADKNDLLPNTEKSEGRQIEVRVYERDSATAKTWNKGPSDFTVNLKYENWLKMKIENEKKARDQSMGLIVNVEEMNVIMEAGGIDGDVYYDESMESSGSTVSDGSGSSQKKKVKSIPKTCLRGQFHQYVSATLPFQYTITRLYNPANHDGASNSDSRIKTSRAQLGANIASRIVNMAYVGEPRNIKTGKAFQELNAMEIAMSMGGGGMGNSDSKLDIEPDFSSGTCKVMIHGYKDANGNELYNRPSTAFGKVMKCDQAEMQDLTDDLLAKFDNCVDGVAACPAGEITWSQSTDTHIACAGIVSRATKMVIEEKIHKTTQCTTPEPKLCPGQSLWDYCNENRSDAWCSDPCCNIELQSTQCCKPYDVKVELPVPTIHSQRFGFACPGAGMDAIEGISTFSAITEQESNPNVCFSEDGADFGKQIRALENTGFCCHAITYGADPYREMYSIGLESGQQASDNSIQLCAVDSDCFSGVCLNQGSGSSGSSTGSSSSAAGLGSMDSSTSSSSGASVPGDYRKCFSNAGGAVSTQASDSSGLGSNSQSQAGNSGSNTNQNQDGNSESDSRLNMKDKKYFCAKANPSNEKQVLGECLQVYLQKKAAGIQKAWVMAGVVLTGNIDGKLAPEKLAGAILNRDANMRYVCSGGYDSWKYTPEPWNEECGDDPVECEKQCLAEQKCNWTPPYGVVSLTSAECAAGPYGDTSDTHFCERKKSSWQYHVEGPDKKQSTQCYLSSYTAARIIDPSSNFWDYQNGGMDSSYFSYEYGSREYALSSSGGPMHGRNLTNAQCDKLSPGATAVQNGEYAWDVAASSNWNYYEEGNENGPPLVKMYSCKPNGLSSPITKADCLDECIGSTNGFRPTVIRSCRAEKINGACPKNFRMEAEYDWEIMDHHTGMPRLIRETCVPAHGDMLTNWDSPTSNWKYHVSSAVWVDNVYNITHNSTYRELKYQINGSSDNELYFPHDFDYFSGNDNRCDYLLEGGITASPEIIDDGSGMCSTDDFICFLPNINSYSACTSESMTFTPPWKTSSSMSGAVTFTFEWYEAYREGQGSCLAHLYYDKWESKDLGPDDVQTLRNSCVAMDSNSGKFYFPREYRKGEFETQSDCENNKQCLVSEFQTIPISSEFTEQDCQEENKRCFGHGKCKGCERNWAANSEYIDGKCYKSVTSKSLCTGTDYDGNPVAFYPNNPASPNGAGLCEDPDSNYMAACTKPKKWYTCYDFEYETCNLNGRTNGTGLTQAMAISDALNCIPTQEAVCKDQQSCESAGTCEYSMNSHYHYVPDIIHGPKDIFALKSTMTTTTTEYDTFSSESDYSFDYDYWEEQEQWLSDRYYPHFFSHYCRIPIKDLDSLDFDWNNPCNIPQNDLTDLARIESGSYEYYDYEQEKEVTEYWYYDPFHYQDGGNCLDFTKKTKEECEAVTATETDPDLKAKWLPTKVSQESCTESKVCSGSSGFGYNLADRGPVACADCGGTRVSPNIWTANYWGNATLQSDGNSWKERKMEVVNTWEKSIDVHVLIDAMLEIGKLVLQEKANSQLYCFYGKSSKMISSIIDICDVGRVQGAWNATCATADKIVAYKDVGANLGTETGFSASISKDALTGGSGSNSSLMTMCMQSSNPNNNIAQGPAVIGDSVRNLVSSRELSSEPKSTDAGCWSKVKKDGNGFLVGQILGDCMTINDASNNVPQGETEVKLKVNTAIDEFSGYTKYDIIERSAVKDTTSSDYLYKPLEITKVAYDGTQLIAKITSSDIANGKMICPGKTVSSPSSATQDTGSNSCPYIANQLEAISLAAQKVGGIQIAGTSTLSLEPVDINGTDINEYIDPDALADSRRISGDMELSMSCNNVADCAKTLNAQEDVVKAIKTGISGSVSISGSKTLIDKYLAVNDRRLKELARLNSLDENGDIKIKYEIKSVVTDSDTSTHRKSDHKDPALALEVNEANKKFLNLNSGIEFKSSNFNPVSNSIHPNRPRKLSSSSATIEVGYTIVIPSSTANIDLLAEELISKLTEGTDSSKGFQVLLTQSINAALVASGLDGSTFSVTGVKVIGTPTLSLESSYNERRGISDDDEGTSGGSRKSLITLAMTMLPLLGNLVLNNNMFLHLM